MPRATERTVSIRSDTTRSPESSSVSCGPSGVTSGPVRKSARLPAVAPVVAVPAVAAAATAAAVSAAAPATIAAAPARALRAIALVARADRGQLGRRLAGDLRVVRKAQADAATLLVDLDDADVDLVAAVEHVLDGLGALAGLHVRDVQQAVGALGELDEGAEGGRLDDLALELVADLDLLGHRPGALDQRVALGARLGVDQDRAVLLHVDLGL